MKKIQIPDVTLITFASIRIPEHIEAMNKCVENIDFGAIKLLSNKKPDNLPDYAEFIEINPINDIMDYNRFAFADLGYYVETSHALLFQDHAYILNANLWEDEWLRFDYIGAVWPLRENSYIANNDEIVRNGNGGFSLRSKKLMRLPKQNGWYLKEEQGFYNEDGNTTCYWRKEFLDNGVIYAPVEVAAKFSFETAIEENDFGAMPTFGFHKYLPNIHNLEQVITLQ